MLLRLCVHAQVWKAGIRERLVGEHGATAVEYALMLALIFMVVFAAVAFLGQSTSDQFGKVDFEP